MVRPGKLCNHGIPTQVLALQRAYHAQKSFALVSDRIMLRLQASKITVVQRKWLMNSHWATEASDVQGQHAFYNVFHECEGFTRCEQYLHSLSHALYAEQPNEPVLPVCLDR